uniref:HesA/MoeB/ThiF family protein n=1 Tax=Lachnospira eligens TaxID=39485 RepID=UPI0040291E2D
MNEELTTQESLPATMQEAYGSLMESINDDHIEEFNREGEASMIVINALLIGIREGEAALHSILPLNGVAHTYRIVYSNVHDREPLHIYVNEHFKDIISEAWDSVAEISTNDTGDEISFELSEEEQAILDQAVEDAHQEIPTNSATLLVDEATSRFSSAIWYENIQKKTVILAGVGGIGSYVGFLLARMKPASMFIYDDDIVEAVNMSGQLYGQSDLGRTKVSALAEMIRNYAGYSSVFAINERFTNESEASDIMICGFDNMAARRLFFNKWVNHVQSKPEEERKNCLFIDGRLAAEEFQVLCIKGDDEYNINRYNNEFLFSDAEADETICSYKQTTFCANMIASYMVNLFVNFCANQCEPLIDRDLPFLTTYNAETMYLKTEV